MTLSQPFKMYGLQRSGTNLMHWLARRNFLLYSAERGRPWKHGPLKRFPDTDKDGKDVRLIICVKDVYAWLVSLHKWVDLPGDNITLRRFGLKRGMLFPEFLRHPCAGSEGPAAHWSKQNQQYLEAVEQYPELTFLVQAHELLGAQAQLKVLKRMSEAWKLKPKNGKYRTEHHQMSARGHPLTRPARYEKYTNKTYLQHYTAADLELVNSQLSQDLMQTLELPLEHK